MPLQKNHFFAVGALSGVGRHSCSTFEEKPHTVLSSYGKTVRSTAGLCPLDATLTSQSWEPESLLKWPGIVRGNSAPGLSFEPNAWVSQEKSWFSDVLPIQGASIQCKLLTFHASLTTERFCLRLWRNTEEIILKNVTGWIQNAPVGSSIWILGTQWVSLLREVLEPYQGWA